MKWLSTPLQLQYGNLNYGRIPLDLFCFQKVLKIPTECQQGPKLAPVAKPPVPGCKTLAANLLARLWNKSHEIQNAETLGAAKKAARKLSKSLLIN